MTGGKQYVKKVFGILGKKRKWKGGAIPIGLLASLGAPILGQIAKPIFGNIFGRGHKLRRRLRRRRRKWEKRFLEKKNIAKKK